LLFALDLASRERQSDGHFDFGTSGVYDRHNASDSTQVSPRVGYTSSFNGIVLSSVVGLDALRWTFASQSEFGGFPTADETAAQYSKAIYARADLLFPTQTRLVVGARRERFSKSSVDALNAVDYEYNNKLNAWELGINQTLASHWDVYARAAKSYRLPNVDENRGSPVNLRAPIAKDREIGLKYARQGTRAALRLFSQHSVDELAYDPGAASLIPFFGANINQDAIARKGVEMEVSTSIATAWEVAASLQSIKASYTDGPNQGKLVPLVDKLTLSTRVAYRLAAQHRLELVAKHHSSSVLGIDYSNKCSERIPALTTFDMGYRFNQTGDKEGARGWALRAGIDNLTGKNSYSFAYAAPLCANSTAYPEPGRTFKMNARYLF
jgi:iron complex outermembrane recepter protein